MPREGAGRRAADLGGRIPGQAHDVADAQAALAVEDKWLAHSTLRVRPTPNVAEPARSRPGAITGGLVSREAGLGDFGEGLQGKGGSGLGALGRLRVGL